MVDALPLTWRGAGVAVVAALALWRYGYERLDLVLFVVGIAGLVLVALAAVTVTTTALVLRRRLTRSGPDPTPGRLECGSPIRTGVALPSLDRVPLVELAWSWLAPPAVDCRQRRLGGRRLEEVIATRRFAAAGVVRRFVVGDVFGLARVAWERTSPVAVVALPARGRLRQVPTVQSLAAAEGLPHPRGAPEGDRMEIRRYAPGDSMRSILWKSFAKTRQLNVRLPERSVERARRTVAYLVAAPGDEASAAAARVALENGELGRDWRFAADGGGPATDELGAALAAIARSGDRDGTAPSGVAAFVETMRREGEMSCVVFVPARPGAWLEGVLAAARTTELSFVVGTDGVAAGRSPSPWWRRLLMADPPAAGTAAEDLGEVTRRLGAVGPVSVVDRVTGRAWGDRSQAVSRLAAQAAPSLRVAV